VTGLAQGLQLREVLGTARGTLVLHEFRPSQKPDRETVERSSAASAPDLVEADPCQRGENIDTVRLNGADQNVPSLVKRDRPRKPTAKAPAITKSTPWEEIARNSVESRDPR
jgi:hypothetical protein